MLYGSELFDGPGAPLSAPYQNPDVSAWAGAGTPVPASRTSAVSTPARAGGLARRTARVARLLTAAYSGRAPARTGDTETGPYGANRAATVNEPATPGSRTRSRLTAGPGRPVLGLKSR